MKLSVRVIFYVQHCFMQTRINANVSGTIHKAKCHLYLMKLVTLHSSEGTLGAIKTSLIVSIISSNGCVVTGKTEPILK